MTAPQFPGSHSVLRGRRSHRRALPIFAVGIGFSAASGDPGPGVSHDLSKHRRAVISDVRYDLHLAVPAEQTDPVTGRVRVSFRLANPEKVVLDFRAPRSNVGAVTSNGRAIDPILSPDHITIPATAVHAGTNVVTLAFTSTDAALNRRGDYLYALFVPDRAATAFPCFDQPDLKARFRLSLTVPPGWRAVANGSTASRDSSASQPMISFRETLPISTYLFSFAAGKLQVDEADRDGRHFTMYHRETDSAKVARNRDAIYDLHAAALRWLEDYTGIKYPFEKFDFFAIPAFQFGGMEHPGAVWYSAGALFLDQAATQNQLLGRANVISHETAHMWFGDLVTMEWFNDVWMKEVFANFMADKIVGPSFPAINHQLRFFLGHHPSAYATDRTMGANPIRQPLDNLRDAGSLYGAIIYQKAPIVMRQLERTIGEEAMRAGLREYLDRHRFGNASWPDLIAILDRKTPEDLRTWSRIWVEEPGRPTIALRYSPGRRAVVATQRDGRGRGLLWSQQFGVTFGDGVTLGAPDSTRTVVVGSRGRQQVIPVGSAPRFLLGGTDGIGYGRFEIDAASRAALLNELPGIGDPLIRSAGWQTLFEDVSEGSLAPERYLATLVAALPKEQDDLISEELLGQIGTIYWRYLPDPRRRALATIVEEALWAELDRATTPGRKGAYFNALMAVTLTTSGTGRLERIWHKDETLAGLPLEEQQYVGLAEALALRGVSGAPEILDEQERRIGNPDRLARFRFVRKSLSADRTIRDSVFGSFKELANRSRESWVLDAMGYLSHPLRATESERYIQPSLELLEEIKATGDIFFPLAWLSAALDGHQSAAAATIVADFLRTHPMLPARLRGKLLQAADGLFRAAAVVDGWSPPRPTRQQRAGRRLPRH